MEEILKKIESTWENKSKIIEKWFKLLKILTQNHKNPNFLNLKKDNNIFCGHYPFLFVKKMANLNSKSIKKSLM